jgi:signal transduction histidine kinase
MSGVRRALMWGHVFLAVAVWAMAVIGASRWPGTNFPGFLLLDNRVIASAGLAHWPGTSDGVLFQTELVSAEGRPVGSAREFAAQIARRSEGERVEYVVRRTDGSTSAHTIAVRRFGGWDFLLLFGPYILTSTTFLILSVLVRVLRRDDSLAAGIAAFSLVSGLYSLTAMDLYGPYRLFRLHALGETLMIPAALHIALVFPRRSALLDRVQRLPAWIWIAGGLVAGAGQLTLYEPWLYTLGHQLSVTGMGASMAVLIAVQIGSYLRSPSFQVRQRVRVVALAAFLAFTPILLLGIVSTATGGRIQQNLMAFTAVLFPVALGYAALRHDLLEVDVLIRRSVSYALLTAGIAALYAGILGGFEAIWADAFERDRELFALVVGIVCVGLLLPLRDLVQRAVDRIFFRTTYDYRQTLEATSRKLAAVADLGTIREVLQSCLGEALHPKELALLVERGGRFEPVGPAPAWLDPALASQNALTEFEDGSVAVAFRTEERTVALLYLGARLSGKHYSGQDRALLLTLANQGAIAVQNALALEALSELNRTLEQKVRDRTRELQATMDELRRAQSQLVHGEKMASIGRFVAGIAHELNNPVGFVLGNMHFLQTYTGALARMLEAYRAHGDQFDAAAAGRLDELRAELDLDYILADIPSLFEGCVEGIQRAMSLVRDLRTFSRIDQSDLLEVDLHESIDSTLNLLRSRLGLVRLEREYGQLPPVECLAGQLNHVLMNLIVNALDAMDEQGVLAIRTRSLEGERVRIEIEDSGCGIPPDVLDHIFEPFFTTKEVGKGTGLGLAISYGIVTRHRGSIAVQSEPGRTCFAVELPVRFQGELDSAELGAAQ